MPILPESAEKIRLPKLVECRQQFPHEAVGDVANATKDALTGLDQLFGTDDAGKEGQNGKTAAVLVGSRNISGLSGIVKTTVTYLKAIGLTPFIIPSMGSHGGGDASEQKAILARYGVTENAMGAEVRSSMETVLLGETKEGIPIHIDRFAAEADFIVPVVRIKAHTSFSGPVESGFCKMLTIGLGKHEGCSRLHREGFDAFPKLIPEAAEAVLAKKKILFGVGVIENAHEQPCEIVAVRGHEILACEPELLKRSKAMMPKLNFGKIDVLVVEQIGKDISGTGMDPNITGRSVPGRKFDFDGPEITRIVVLGLSEGTHGNASGIGRADFITQKCFEAIDPVSTYANCIAAGVPDSARIPIVLATEEEAIRAAVLTCPGVDPENVRIVRIKDTLHLTDILVSENLLSAGSIK